MIYIVEDDENIRQMESYALQKSGYETEEFSESTGFFAALGKRMPDLVILDIMLPGEDGLSVLRRLRADVRTQSLPIIMVTAKSSEMDTVRGLDAGADDYIIKPFGIMEFIARVRAMLRRFHVEKDGVFSFGEIVMDDEKHLVTVSGSPCTLTYKEYETLKCFLQNPGIVLSRERLLNRVWGVAFEGESRTVDMHIKTLRQKLGKSGALIKTVRNVGYKLE